MVAVLGRSPSACPPMTPATPAVLTDLGLIRGEKTFNTQRSNICLNLSQVTSLMRPEKTLTEMGDMCTKTSSPPLLGQVYFGFF